MAKKAKSGKLTFWECYSQSLGVVIGVGIISTSGVVIGHTGTGVWLAFLVAGLAFLVTYLPTLIGASVVPRTSGTYFMVGQLGVTAKGIMAFMLLTQTISIAFRQSKILGRCSSDRIFPCQPAGSEGYC